MAFLDELGKTLTKTSQKISQTGQTVAKKAKDMAEVSNLKLQVKEEERQLRGIYEEIGEKYCDLYGECPEEVLKEEIQRVTEAKVKIQALKENIAKFDNGRVCQNCSAKLPEKGQFCPACGMKYPEPEPGNEEEWEDAIDVDAVVEDVKENTEAEEEPETEEKPASEAEAETEEKAEE